MGKNKVKERIGETRIMNCGMSATIIMYQNANVTHKRYKHYKKDTYNIHKSNRNKTTKNRYTLAPVLFICII